MFLRANFSGPVPSAYFILEESKALLQEIVFFSDLSDTFNVKYLRLIVSILCQPFEVLIL